MINKERYLKQFDTLIEQGKSLGYNRLNFHLPNENFDAWRTRCTIILQSVLPKTSIILESIRKINGSDSYIAQQLWGMLVGCRQDFEDGFLDDLSQRIESAVAVNYLEQAEALIEEKGCAASHIPAAVLAGAVLEKALRTLCEKQIPPIKVKKSNGDFKTATPLTEDLLKMEVITPLQKKKLDVWIKIRNDAAHGHSENIRPQDVQDMIAGITDFLDMMMN